MPHTPRPSLKRLRPSALPAALLVATLAWTACAPTPEASAPADQGVAAVGMLAENPAVATAPAERPAVARHGMVVSAHTLASQVGTQVLREGGNAVDAAVATALALAVVYPRAGNIGGGGFMVIRFPDGEATAIDFRETAPLAAHPEMWLDENGEYDSTRHHLSHRAVGVPGTVAGLVHAHERYGVLPWERLVEPAIRLAAEGWELTPGVAASLASRLAEFRRYPATLSAFSRDGQPYRAGDRFRQPDLAATLTRIRDRGRDGFYAGETARLLVAEMERGGGLVTLEDLARYRPVEREPIRGTYRGYGIIGMPPPSSGGTVLVAMLNILEGYEGPDGSGLARFGHNTAGYLHLLAESMRRGYRDRALWIADPDFEVVPVARLTSKAYAAERRSTIDPDTVTPSSVTDVRETAESPETTHFSVVDSDGMAVATTYTLEYSYGSRIVVPGAGFLLNNEMGDFNPAPGLTTEAGLIGTTANLAEPGKRMLSSMSPTILVRPARANGDSAAAPRPGELFAVLGSPGGRRIINIVLQVALNLMDHEMGLLEAIEAPRVHHQWFPDELDLEGGAWPASTLEGLRARGHALEIDGDFGHVHAIRVAPDGLLEGAPDPRDADAAAIGY